ncbi:MAG: Mut7-C RNAse domain-containing protein [Bdellovibrionota bacterium]
MNFKLLVDENLAKLGRWCRFLGIDTVLPSGWKDKEISELAISEGRLLVSRDRKLCEMHSGQSLWIRSDDFNEQLKEVIGLQKESDEEQWFTICVECNIPLRSLPSGEKEADARIPVEWRTEPCWECITCGRAYWRGSHFLRTRDTLRKLSEKKDRH